MYAQLELETVAPFVIETYNKSVFKRQRQRLIFNRIPITIRTGCNNANEKSIKNYKFRTMTTMILT